MRTRKEILIDLVQNKKEISDLTKELSHHSWDYDEPLYIVTAQDVYNVLNTLDAETLENWANAIESREELDFENEELQEMIHELANPILFGTISNEKIESLKKHLQSLYGNNGNEEVVCCFCGKSLEIEKAVLIQVFPVMNDKESQQLFCHRICMDELLHKSIPRHPELLS